VTFRFAARFADELNLVFINPDQVAEVLPIIRQRCEEESRDPATLRVSIYTRDDDIRAPGAPRVEILGRFADLGLDRIICFPTKWVPDGDAQARFAEDARAAGLLLADATAAPA
jgi:alkanesulfonate monooxygenase SsuD/methylene tetrahydromethanopterin reductase-like flavin-dependent oxidoreductase (luciferase family)